MSGINLRELTEQPLFGQLKFLFSQKALLIHRGNLGELANEYPNADPQESSKARALLPFSHPHRSNRPGAYPRGPGEKKKRRRRRRRS